MTIELTWFDALLIALLAGTTVIGMRRGLAGLFAALGGLALWPLLNWLGFIHPVVALVLALGLGTVLGQLARSFVTWPAFTYVTEVTQAALGGLGGLVLGLGLVAALALSFPIRPNPAAGPGQFRYPSDNLAPWLGATVERSLIQRLLTNPRRQGGLNIWRGSPAVRALLVPDRNAP